MANVRYPGTAGTTPGTITAADVTFDNTTSGLTADDVQEAIDEIEGQISGLSYDASDISYDNTTSGLTADDVQEAIDEIDSNLDTLDGKVYKTDDSTETTIASDDLLPIYDTSATASKKITVENVVKATVSNPNLIDNPWFTVNQRGQASYTGSIYTVDRWKGTTDQFILTVNADNSVTLSKGSAGAVWLTQYIENDSIQRLVGKTVTLSVDVSAYSGNSNKARLRLANSGGSVVGSASFTISKTGISFASVEVPATATQGRVEIYNDDSTDNSGSITIKAVKLEVGSISTLALDTAPNYATELLKCQRYFQRIGGTNSAFANGWFTTASLAYLFTKLSTPMRTAPAVTMNGSVYVWSPTKQASSSYALTSINASSYENNGIEILVFNTGGSETVGVNALGQFRDTTSHIDLSADL